MIKCDFTDAQCTCACGNTHELYGGKGYTDIDYSHVEANIGIIHREYTCKVCGKKHIYHDDNIQPT